MQNMNTTNMPAVYFSVDFFEKKINGTALNFRKASVPGSNQYKALMKIMATHPGFSLNAIQPKKKRTYKGLTFEVMKEYILAHENSEELMDEFEGIKAMCAEKYPIVKKWFLETFKDEVGVFKMLDAKRRITDNKINRAVVAVKAMRNAVSASNPQSVNG